MNKEHTPHQIHSTLPDRYARGWYCLGLAKDYTEKPQLLKYFGTALVAYRGDDGEVHILDAYCPHMGASLHLGCVEGNSIRCLFHAWKWGPDGVCNEIPYAEKIPAKAVIKSWPTMEENQLLFVWNDHEQLPPIEEQRIERITSCFDEEWVGWAMDKMTIHTNCRELVDNMADVGHFGPVHGAPPNSFHNIIEKHKFTQYMTGSSEALAADGELASTATYYGPAYMNTYMTGTVGGIEVESRLLVTHVPIDHNSFDLRFGVLVKKNSNLSEEENAQMVQQYVDLNNMSFGQDVDIWHNKVRVDNPILCDHDGPVYKLRQWYEQFYMDRKDVPNTWQSSKRYDVEVIAASN